MQIIMSRLSKLIYLSFVCNPCANGVKTMGTMDAVIRYGRFWIC